ncbi:MAG: hypothetical protein U0P81_10335 [Holophagaceae bacterium]
MILGTAAWLEGPVERRALVARLGEDRVADLSRVEVVRLRKLGEGRAEDLAEALVPSSLRLLLESGPRALQRAKQTLAYAEKWAKRGDLPDSLAPRLDSVRLLPCLPRPAALRTTSGVLLDRLALRGPGAELAPPAFATLAVAGLSGGRIGGWCLALEGADATAIGGWLCTGSLPAGRLELAQGPHHRSAPLAAWEEAVVPDLRPAELCLLPPPRWKALPEAEGPLRMELRAPWETLRLTAASRG